MTVMYAVFISSTKLPVRLQTQSSMAPLMLRHGAHTKDSSSSFFPTEYIKGCVKQEIREKGRKKKLFGNISGRTDQNIQMNSD